MRQIVSLNDTWCFHKGDIPISRPSDKRPTYLQAKTERKRIGPAAYFYFDRPDRIPYDCEVKSEGWRYVDVPHDYIIDQNNSKYENDSHGYFKYDNAWYRKHFTVDPSWIEKRVTLQFEGIAGHSTVYLNGCLLKHNFSSYNSFEIDITNYLYFDKENVLAVYVNTEEFEGWWYQGGGIYRDVRLVATSKVAIDLYGVYAPTVKMDEKNWRVDFETTVINTDLEDCGVLVKSAILDSDGNEVAGADGKGTIPLMDKATVCYSARVQSPKLWDTDHPNLYTVRTTLFKNGKLIDEDTTRIGFRTIEIVPNKGLLLNGKLTFIKGVCAHQDFGLTGLAVPDNIARYKVGLYKEMGANGFRTSHYQNSTATMDALDEMGFLVMDEARWFETSEEAVRQLETLVKRDRNRPSVVFWSTGNEELHQRTEVGIRIHRELKQRILKLDRQHFITSACNHPEEVTIFDDCDLIAINYGLLHYDMLHEKYPDVPFLASECCATGTTRDWNFESDLYGGRFRDYDQDATVQFLSREKTWKFFMERPYIIGCYQWAATEHRGEATWPTVCSKSGALDLFLQKKGAFYQNQSHWTEDPMVHIVPHWNFKGLEGKEILVTVYTNCDELELFLNGKSFGKKEIERYGHGEWKVPFEPGELEVKGWKDGVLCARDRRVTTGKPAALKLTLDNAFEANGQDLALFTCECVDEDGNTVPDAAEFVRFSVNTPAIIVGTGSDNCDHNTVASQERKMYMGKIRVAVKPAVGQEKLILTALGDNGTVSCIEMDL